MADREKATGDLGLIQAFVNTVDLMPLHEQLQDPNTLQAWLVANGLMDASDSADEADLKHAIAVREAMRGLIGGNSGVRVYPIDLATLTKAAGESRLRLEPEASGAVGAIGRLVATLYAAMQEEGWERLKLCSSDPCRWVFYDRSKNQSSRWCKMASCGNREKARRFRERITRERRQSPVS